MKNKRCSAHPDDGQCCLCVEGLGDYIVDYVDYMGDYIVMPLLQGLYLVVMDF